MFSRINTNAIGFSNCFGTRGGEVAKAIMCKAKERRKNILYTRKRLSCPSHFRGISLCSGKGCTVID